jgi:hypothetical protein
VTSSPLTLASACPGFFSFALSPHALKVAATRISAAHSTRFGVEGEDVVFMAARVCVFKIVSLGLVELFFFTEKLLRFSLLLMHSGCRTLGVLFVA